MERASGFYEGGVTQRASATRVRASRAWEVSPLVMPLGRPHSPSKGLRVRPQGAGQGVAVPVDTGLPIRPPFVRSTLASVLRMARGVA
jgi:hypothetical protein